METGELFRDENERKEYEKSLSNLKMKLAAIEEIQEKVNILIQQASSRTEREKAEAKNKKLKDEKNKVWEDFVVGG